MAFHNRGEGFTNLLILSGCLLLLFLGFNTAQFFITSLLGELGFWSLAVLYAVFSISNLLVSASIVHFLGEKYVGAGLELIVKLLPA